MAFRVRIGTIPRVADAHYHKTLDASRKIFGHIGYTGKNHRTGRKWLQGPLLTAMKNYFVHDRTPRIYNEAWQNRYEESLERQANEYYGLLKKKKVKVVEKLAGTSIKAGKGALAKTPAPTAAASAPPKATTPSGVVAPGVAMSGTGKK